jgi:hypothetical protein
VVPHAGLATPFAYGRLAIARSTWVVMRSFLGERDRLAAAELRATDAGNGRDTVEMW